MRVDRPRQILETQRALDGDVSSAISSEAFGPAISAPTTNPPCGVDDELHQAVRLLDRERSAVDAEVGLADDDRSARRRGRRPR